MQTDARGIPKGPTWLLPHRMPHLDAPSSEYFPLGHLKHGLSPVSTLYQPQAHVMQFPLEPVWPTSHPQSLSSSLPACEIVLAPQSWHESAPSVVEYLPAAQSWHVPSVSAPSVVEYLPAAQSWHVLARAVSVGAQCCRVLAGGTVLARIGRCRRASNILQQGVYRYNRRIMRA